MAYKKSPFDGWSDEKLLDEIVRTETEHKTLQAREQELSESIARTRATSEMRDAKSKKLFGRQAYSDSEREAHVHSQLRQLTESNSILERMKTLRGNHEALTLEARIRNLVV